MSNSNEVRKFLQRIVRALKKIHVSLVELEESSKGKRQFLCTLANGNTAIWRVSKTPRDRNGIKSAARDLRKILISNGAVDTAAISFNYLVIDVDSDETVWNILAEYESSK